VGGKSFILIDSQLLQEVFSAVFVPGVGFDVEQGEVAVRVVGKTDS
jgi:hypothetical protein